MCELQRTIDNEMKLQEFLGVKGQLREMSDLNAKKVAERQAKREEMRRKIANYNRILTLVKQFTGNFMFIVYFIMNGHVVREIHCMSKKNCLSDWITRTMKNII